jgi:hypothetical protein
MPDIPVPQRHRSGEPALLNRQARIVLIPPPGLHVMVAGQSRPGALLGNLVCNLAHGLDSPRPAAAPAPGTQP